MRQPASTVALPRPGASQASSLVFVKSTPEAVVVVGGVELHADDATGALSREESASVEPRLARAEYGHHLRKLLCCIISIDGNQAKHVFISPKEAKFKSQPSTQPATFTIATFLPARSHRDDEYEDLRGIHRHAFTNALDDEDSAQETPNLSHSAATPSVTSTTARAAADIWRKPQFNTASAQELLKTFVSISENLPFVKLPNECTVPQLAATQPFVLLAILTVTSGLGSVQKHSLYDDEFLKILGLKYVSGGDGSLELLRGLLIYCAW